MTNIKPTLKRVSAYIIDLFIVLIFASLITSIPIFNKYMKNYQKTYSKYENKYNDYEEYLNLLKESYLDDEINEEEYNKLTESKEYKQIIINNYEDNKISKGEYKEIINDINKEFDKTAKDYIYILNKKGLYNSLITLLCTLIYFGIIQCLLKGQTIGKKILKLKVVSSSSKKINILNFILRSLIVNDVLLNGISILLLILTSKSIYNSANNIINILISISEAIIIYLVLTREDGRGLHDLLFNTQVISIDDTANKDNVIEAEYQEEVEKNEKGRTKGKRRTKK